MPQLNKIIEGADKKLEDKFHIGYRFGCSELNCDIKEIKSFLSSQITLAYEAGKDEGSRIENSGRKMYEIGKKEAREEFGKLIGNNKIKDIIQARDIGLSEEEEMFAYNQALEDLLKEIDEKV